MTENSVDCDHEYYNGICINCGKVFDKKNPDGRVLKELPRSIDLQPSAKKERNEGLPQHVALELEREDAAKRRQATAQPKLKDQKEIDLDITINKFSVAWSESENQIFLRDEIYNKNLATISFDPIITKLSREKKLDIINSVLESLQE